jgi:hypothetical protein
MKKTASKPANSYQTNRAISKGFSAAYLLTALVGKGSKQVSIARNLWNLFGRK